MLEEVFSTWLMLNSALQTLLPAGAHRQLVLGMCLDEMEGGVCVCVCVKSCA